MPVNYGSMLNDKQINDLVSYLLYVGTENSKLSPTQSSRNLTMMTNNHLSFSPKDSRFNIVIRKVAIAALTLLLIAGSAHRPGYGEANNGAFELQAITPEF